MNRRPAENGYTVIELLVVMTVMAIIAAFSYAQMRPALQHSKVRGAANVMASDLQYAQMLAVRYRTPIVLTVDGTAKTYAISARGGSPVYRTQDFGTDGDYNLGSISATSTAVEFFPSGLAGTSVTYTLQLDVYSRNIALTQAGQIRVTQ